MARHEALYARQRRRESPSMRRRCALAGGERSAPVRSGRIVIEHAVVRSRRDHPSRCALASERYPHGVRGTSAARAIT